MTSKNAKRRHKRKLRAKKAGRRTPPRKKQRKVTLPRSERAQRMQEVMDSVKEPDNANQPSLEKVVGFEPPSAEELLSASDSGEVVETIEDTGGDEDLPLADEDLPSDSDGELVP
jgi:hypothetical protein